MAAIWVAGEILIDLIPVAPGSEQRNPVVGGGPANTAKALAKLGFESYFIDGFSSNEYGQMGKAELLRDGVKLDYAPTFDLPMCLATVSLDLNGSASYEFLIDGTATFAFDRSWLPDPKLNPAVLHVGTLGTLVEPGASVLHSWASEFDSPIVYDPNIRPSVEGDLEKYRASVIKWAAISKVVKMSDDDVAWLFPDRSHADVAALFLNMGVQLFVITLGADGIIAYNQREQIKVAGVKITVADTVGAGDTVGAILVEGIVSYGLNNLHGEILEKVLTRAAAAAAITCSRPGANPPNKAELMEC